MGNFSNYWCFFFSIFFLLNLVPFLMSCSLSLSIVFIKNITGRWKNVVQYTTWQSLVNGYFYYFRLKMFSLSWISLAYTDDIYG